jgi:hypothetical protein
MRSPVALIILLVSCIAVSAQGPFQTSLTHGNHQVGFRQKTYFDPGRPPLAEQSATFQNGRAVHLSIWYPASVKESNRTMNFNEYVDFLATMINPETPTPALKKRALQQFNLFTSQLGGDTIVLKKHIEDLMNSPTRAHLNANIQTGNFPVLFYPESAHLASLMGEYIASHGYIVVCVSRFGTLDAEFEWQNVRGIETLVQDCQFALASVKHEFKLTDPKIAAMGIGMNASAGLAWMMRSPEVEALVSLEGGILTGYEFGLLQKSPYYSVAAASKPMMVAYSPHPAVDPQFIDNYKYADRYMVFMPDMTEYYYLNFGVWAGTMQNVLGRSPGDTRKGFEVVSQYMLQFLNATLKDMEDGKQFLAKTPSQAGVLHGGAEFSLKKGAPVPPTKAELDKVYAQSGIDALVKKIRQYAEQSGIAIPVEIMAAFGTQFIQRQAYDEGLQWAALFQQSYPEAVTAYTIAGRCNLELGKKESALAMYSKALEVLPADHSLDETGKQQLKTAIENRVHQLTRS